MRPKLRAWLFGGLAVACYSTSALFAYLMVTANYAAISTRTMAETSFMTSVAGVIFLFLWFGSTFGEDARQWMDEVEEW